MSAARKREIKLLVVAIAGVLTLAGLFAGWVIHAMSTLLPGNEDVLLRNATACEIVDVVVLRGQGENATEVARIQRLAPGGEAVASAGLGRISVEFSDARGRWVAPQVMWRDEDDVRGLRAPELLELTADRVGRTTLRRKP